ncbi:peptidase domain-containing ABC transporter [Marinimicrococcus flavescens]|uniref:Peptidase domain-containing ABC transporter n=1 Tax=Marinimicrococcus flavescens TaxID=3031815 RepID=A0AAP4D6N7_9PROT|nr:peptidase domain-containing ABC transporter [Marinimicrococcus flavescens]
MGPADVSSPGGAAAIGEAPSPGGPGEVVLAAFVRLCRQLGKTCGEGELRSVAQRLAAGEWLPAVLELGRKAGLAGRRRRAVAWRLRLMRPPFLLLGHEPGEAWLVRARVGSQLVLVDARTGEAATATPEGAARKAATALVFRDTPAWRRSAAPSPAGDAAPPRDEPRSPALPAPSATPRGGWRQPILAPLWPALWQIGLASVLINLLALAVPLFMMTVYNKVINHGALQTLDVLAVGMLTLIACELMLRGVRGRISSLTGARLDVALGREALAHLLRLPYRAFEGAGSAGMLERLRQVDQLRSFLTGQLPLLAVDLAFVALFLVALFVLAPVLAWITLAVVPVFGLLSLVAHREQKELARSGGRSSAARAAALGEAVGQALTVKALGLERVIAGRYEARLLETACTGFRAGSLGNLVGAAGQALQHLAGLVLVYVGARQIVAGELSVGALIAATILAGRVLAPVRQAFFAWHQIQQAREAVIRLAAFMDEGAEEQGGGRAPLARLSGRIALDAVTFRYAADRQPALDGVDLAIEPGTMLGVIGPPGSGKSTLVKLLLGLELPQEGRILVDGRDLREVALNDYRRQIGVVPQDIQLFAGSIGENIALGSAGADPARIVAAAKFVGLHEAILRLPDAYETLLGEGGSGLSAGQRQLLAAARAVVRNPRIIILDEATSALDPASEARLLGNIRRAGRGRTIILVTHRLAALQACDQAVLMQNGRIARQGAPADVAAAAQSRAGRRGLHALG